MAANRVQGGIFTVMVVRITDPYDPALEEELAEQVSRSPGFYADAPVIIDLKDSLSCTSIGDYVALKTVLRRHRMIPVGVQNASALQQRAAIAVDLAPFAMTGTGRKGSERPAPAQTTTAQTTTTQAATADASASASSSATAVAGTRSRLVTQPVRSGTQIYARGGDLVIVAPVSAGAEVIADGHIHVYGTLRGRAIAGASGDAEARIFVHRLEAELLCVAGRYLVNEAIPAEHMKQAVQVALIDDQLRIIPGWGETPGRN
jgi:septum site-determining protein MinC